MPLHHSCLTRLLSTIREAPRKPQFWWTLWTVMTCISVWNTVRTLRLIIDSLEPRLSGLDLLALFLQILVCWLLAEKVSEITRTRQAQSLHPDAGDTQ